MFLDIVIKSYVQGQLFFQRKEAASGIEYAMVAAMVAVVIIAFVTPIGDSIRTIFTNIDTALATAAGT